MSCQHLFLVQYLSKVTHHSKGQKRGVWMSSVDFEYNLYRRYFPSHYLLAACSTLSKLIIWFKMEFQLEFAALAGLTIKLKTTILNWVEISPQFKIIILSWIDNPMQQTQVGIPSWIKWSVMREQCSCLRITRKMVLKINLFSGGPVWRRVSTCSRKLNPF